MRCPNCGKEVQDGFLVCPDCSEMLPINDDTNTNNYNNYNNYSNYDSGTYTSPSYTDVGNNYKRKSPKNLKLYILIILVAFSVIAYSATTKNGIYEYKGDDESFTLDVGMKKYTLTWKLRIGGQNGEVIYSGKSKFSGSTGTLTINEIKAVSGGTEVSLNDKTFFKIGYAEIKCKYSPSKKTMTIEFPAKSGEHKYTLKKKRWFG